jgi:hypothetical protein
VSRDGLHAIDVPGIFEAEGSFDVRLVNHGISLPLHVHLDDVLWEVAALSATNHYVEGESERIVRVEVDEARLPAEPVRGKLKLVSAYGASTRWVEVLLSEPDEEAESVQVDASLSKPQPAPAPESSDTGSLLANPEVPVIGLAAIAVTVAVVAILVVRDTVVLGGAMAVVAAVLVAGFLLLRG